MYEYNGKTDNLTLEFTQFYPFTIANFPLDHITARYYFDLDTDKIIKIVLYNASDNLSCHFYDTISILDGKKYVTSILILSFF